MACNWLRFLSQQSKTLLGASNNRILISLSSELDKFIVDLNLTGQRNLVLQ